MLKNEEIKMIDQYTYELLKRLQEFPCKWDENQLEFGRFHSKYKAIYGNDNAVSKLISQLKSLGYLETREGMKFFLTEQSINAIIKYEDAIAKNNERNQIENENIRLQNEQFHYQNQVRDKENKIRNLTTENLKLQNKQLKNKIIYAIIGVVVMFFLSNWKDILIMLQIIDKQ